MTNLQHSFNEVETDELLQIEGGNWWVITGAIATVIAVIDYGIDAYKGVRDGWNSVK